MKKISLLVFSFLLFSSLSAQISKENLIGKKNRMYISIAGETDDSNLFIEFKDEHFYTFCSPYGGYLWGNYEYKIENNKIYLSKTDYEVPFKINELNIIFSKNASSQFVEFVYNREFYTFSYLGGYVHNNILLTTKDTVKTPDGTECYIGEVKVIKRKRKLVPTENLRIRTKPTTKAATGSIEYHYEFMNLGDNFLGSEYEFNLNQNGESYCDVLLAGLIKTYDAVTAEKQTIDGITAPWYRIRVYDEGEGGSILYYWIFGGYIKEVQNPNIEDYKEQIITGALKKGIIKKIEVVDNSKLLEQANKVLKVAENLYNLRSKIEMNAEKTKEKPRYYTIYYYKDNCTYSTVVEFVNNELLQGFPVKIGMTKQQVIDLWGTPIETKESSIEYNTFESTHGYGYEVEFTIENNKVTKIKCYMEK